MEKKVVKGLIGIYNRCALTVPEKHDTYLVKNSKGIYGVAKYDRKGWHVQGDDLIAWTRLPVTGIKK